MKLNTAPFLSILAVCLLAPGLTLTTPCNAKEKAGASAAAPAQVYTAAETAKFKALAKETLAALGAGNNTVTVAKLTDLETAWDAKEKVLKPKNQDTWTLLDKTLDRAISALRSSKTNIPKGKAALEELLKMLDQATKP